MMHRLIEAIEKSHLSTMSDLSLQVVSSRTTSDAESMLFPQSSETYVGVRSDHTDRELEEDNILLSKIAVPTISTRLSGSSWTSPITGTGSTADGDRPRALPGRDSRDNPAAGGPPVVRHGPQFRAEG